MTRYVLSISSQVAYGPVGNTAAVPALNAAGFTVLEIPTIILSNHPGLGKPAGVRLPAIEIEAILEKLRDMGALADCAGVLTGYFADAVQVMLAAHVISEMRQANPSVFVLVDPILGDHGALYVGEDVARAVRNKLVPIADCITPNAFELAWLSGHPVSTKIEAEKAAAKIGCAEIVAKSVSGENENLLTLAITADATTEIAARRMDGVPHGTGDFLAGLYLGARLNAYAPAEALKLSSAILANAIERSQGEATLDVIGALHG
jgi:pyridoxine kinase